MALTQPRAVFGIDTVAFLNRTTELPYVIFKIPGEASVESKIDTIKLETKGSFRGVIQSEPGKREDMISFNTSQFERGMWEPLAGSLVTTQSAEPTGYVGGLIDKNGTTVVGSTGIATVQIDSGEESKLRNSYWTIRAVSATTVNFYATGLPSGWYASDYDSLGYGGLVNPTPLTVTASTATPVLNANGETTGVEFTGGSGTIALTTGDTATFKTRRINLGSYATILGKSSEVYTDFMVDIYGTQQSSGRNVIVRVYKCSAPGVNINFEALAFSESELQMTASYDAVRDGVWEMTYID